ncbi:cysteine-rich secretory protein 2-like [Melanotaenia boesemani]|uniref:cysteine-rich secretory protein 2-like n=1 Tax=Melanotaenia boesemani TaxID=1250792 RepID=UPI001C04EDD2|nr:cysteine-rich secretory protein 2-like [Melanotaenia boesemani]
MYALSFLCVLCGFIAALQVPGTLADFQVFFNPGTVLASLSDRNEIVNKQKKLRKVVIPTVSHNSWNREAEANAQRWAKTCSMKHSPASSREVSITSIVTVNASFQSCNPCPCADQGSNFPKLKE